MCDLEKCRYCGRTDCDSLGSCSRCGEDMKCTDTICNNCREQDAIDNDDGPTEQGW